MKPALKAMLLFLGFLPLLLACQSGESSTRETETENPVTVILTQPSSTVEQPTAATMLPSSTSFSAPAISYPEEWLTFLAHDFLSEKPIIDNLGLGTRTFSFITQNGEKLIQPHLFDQFRSSSGQFQVWSPDGRYLAFDAADKFYPCSQYGDTDCSTSNYGIFLLDLAESVVVPITSNRSYFSARLGSPSWSPDSENLITALETTATNLEGGRQLAYNLFKFSVNTKTFERLTEDLFSDIYPSWSPDGRLIAFVRYLPESKPKCGPFFPDKFEGCNHGDLYVIKPNGAGLNLLLKDIYVQADLSGRDVAYNTPSWSPDSKWLAVLVGEEQSDIALINVEDGGKRLLVTHPAQDYYASWSPDGKKLVFVSNRDGNEEIYLVSIDGTGLVNLTNHPANEFNPVWSPSGRFIAFLSDREQIGAYKLYVMNADGTAQRNLYDGYVFTRPSWFPPINLDLQNFLDSGNK